MWPCTPERRPLHAMGKQLTTAQKALMSSDLQRAEMSGKRGALAQIHRAWKVTKTTAARVYKLFKAQMVSPGEVNMSRKKRTGRPSTMEARWDEVVGSLPPEKRTTYRKWAIAADTPRTTLKRWADLQKFKSISLRIKPKLSEQHKLNRMKYVLQQVAHLDARHPHYKSMYQRVHIDEKWFYLLENKRTVIVGREEVAPVERAAQHKSHIPKAMFISVVARPDPNFNFNGLIAIEACTEIVVAQRHSKHRKAGDLVEVDVSVTSESYRRAMEDVLLPAIIAAMPHAGLHGQTLVIQHDGAPAHSGKGNAEYWPLMLKKLYHKRRIEIITQPAQSPDLNVNDLGFFNSLQKLTRSEGSVTLSEMLDNVEACFWAYEPETLERVWQAQFNIYNCILQARGGNNFKLPHTGVAKRQRAGVLASEVLALRPEIRACRALVGI